MLKNPVKKETRKEGKKEGKQKRELPVVSNVNGVGSV